MAMETRGEGWGYPLYLSEPGIKSVPEGVQDFEEGA